MLLCILTLTSCFILPDEGGGGNVSLGGEPKRLTTEESKIAVFESYAVEGFWARNDRGNGQPFNCSFSNGNAVIGEDRLTISLTESDGKYVGAEYRSMAKFSYGFFSVKMKAAKGDGIISSFFTYTGHPWDEIDIEFLGDDTTRVQFNYYTRGVGQHEYLYELGFDASEDFHEYAFDWQPDSITWYVDGVAVYRATKNIPTTSGQIMVNIWNVADSGASWAGKFDPKNLPASAEYLWFGYQSADSAEDK
jgi:beta-glucanase (GH16 family)